MNIIIKQLNIGLLISATLLILASSCGKDRNSSKPCRGGRYSFAATGEFSPQREAYNVGDTIFFYSTIPKILYDNVTSQNVDYSNSTGIGGAFRAFSIDSANHLTVSAIDSFGLISVVGSIKDDTGAGTSSSTRSFNYTENSFSYDLSVKIVLLKRGNYQIGLNDLGSRGIRGEDCTNAGFAVRITNSNKHLQILSNAAIPGVILDQFLIDHIYCFRVQ